MINLKDKKETKEKVDEMIKKRTNCTKNEKKSQKKGEIIKKTSKKSTQKKKMSGFKKALILFGLWLLEVLVCGVIVVTFWCINTIKSYTDVYDVVQAQQDLIENLVTEITEIKVQPQAVKTIEVIEPEDDKIYLGNFKITHYCACQKCCGKNAQGITASGKKVEEGKTIAVDPKVIKLGSQVYIDGYGQMEAQDTGSAIKGNIIDIYVADHNEALKLGVTYKDVYLVK